MTERPDWAKLKVQVNPWNAPTPDEQWLAVWQYLESATDEAATDDDTISALVSAVRELVLLLEPPSVRNRRTNEHLS